MKCAVHRKCPRNVTVFLSTITGRSPDEEDSGEHSRTIGEHSRTRIGTSASRWITSPGGRKHMPSLTRKPQPRLRYWRISYVASVCLMSSIPTRGGILSQRFLLSAASSWVSGRPGPPIYGVQIASRGLQVADLASHFSLATQSPLQHTPCHRLYLSIPLERGLRHRVHAMPRPLQVSSGRQECVNPLTRFQL